MKSLVGKIISFICLGITILVSLVFAFIELRTLFAGDYSLFENPTLGLLAYLFRSIFFIGLITLSITIIIFILKKKEDYFGLLFISDGFIVGSIFGVMFYSGLVFALVLFISLLPSMVSGLYFVFSLRKRNIQNNRAPSSL